MKEIIKHKILLNLEPFHLEVIDESSFHKGHIGHREEGETHFKVMVVSKKFEKVSKIVRHQLIYKILSAEMAEKIHALAINAFSIEEYLAMKKGHQFNPTILRAYDIRGIVDQTISLKDAYFLGKALSQIIITKNLKPNVCIGYDGRLTSPALKEMLINGFLDSGVDVINIGLVPTPLLYYSTLKLAATIGVMITGSHNPAEYNGFKIMLEGNSFFGDQIIELANIAEVGEFPIGEGRVDNIDFKDEYVKFLNEKVINENHSSLRIAWDPGNGATGEVVEMLSKIIPGTHFLINEKIDGNFPSHHPDPTVKENLLELIELVKMKNCDFGIAFDGDGDRIGLIDNTGEMVNGEQILFLLSKDLLSRKPGACIIGDVKTSDIIFDEIAKLGGLPIMWRTGHSYIKAVMKEKNALLAGEMSGHVFFAEDYYGFDDAIFGACKFIKFLTNSSETINEMIKTLPIAFSTPELRIEVNEKDKFDMVQRLQNVLNEENLPFNNLDGVRVKAQGGWWIIRASNTQNALIVRVEAVSEKLKLEIFNEMIVLCQKALIPVQDIQKEYKQIG